ncbi:hypothetical protein FIE12Z_5271 [Fusarium flagelliforme]|uniref:Uncharacterized protein n=1 Tax=Fusarium flagelliforme TaxID=2675880 RepID=A0A395MRA8_9HYPO|nr:hypothetical protein FIE12Z_5271 [Fusarium flagelliforme]
MTSMHNEKPEDTEVVQHNDLRQYKLFLYHKLLLMLETDVPLYFLDRSDLWETVKPYNFHYVPKSDVPLHNLQRSYHSVRLRSLRPLVPILTLDKQGFEVERLDTRMQYEDFRDEQLIDDVYFSELEDHFTKKLGAKKIRPLDFQLRLRDREFPYFEGKPSAKPQPSLMTHVDVTPEATKSIIRELYEDTAEEILKGRYQIITVWRPLRVPVRDWPLALCDASTVSLSDMVENDVIYPNYVAENLMIHYSERQRWYWLPDQAEDEVLVFKAVDSDKNKYNRMSPSQELCRIAERADLA